jgi:hypothetical protein
MPSDPELLNQPEEGPKYLVDLDSLQAQSELGVRVDVMQAFRDAVPNEEVSSLVDAMNASGGRTRFSRVSSERIVRQRLGTDLFIKTFDKAIGESSDLQTFAWRTAAAVHVASRGLMYYKKRGVGIDTVRQSFPEVAVSLGRQLLEFCGDHPEVRDEAMEAWFSALSLGAKKQEFMECIGAPLQEAALQRRKKKSTPEQFTNDEVIVGRIMDKIAWPKGISHPIYDTQALISEAELTAVENINPANLELLYEKLAGGLIKVGNPEQLLRPSINATYNLVGSLARVTGDQNSFAKSIYQELQKIKKADELIAYSSLIKLANDLRPIIKDLRSKEGLELPEIRKDTLKEGTLKDFPEAIDIIVSFVVTDPVTQQAIAAAARSQPTIAESFKWDIGCVKLLALQGRDKKLAQASKYSVELLSLGLTTSEIAYVMQGTDLENVTVHDLNRELGRLYRGRRGRSFGFWKPGSGPGS